MQSSIFKNSKIIEREDLVLGDISDLYMHGECGVMTLYAVKELDGNGYRCENLLELVKQMKKWRAAQEKVISDRKMLAGANISHACRLSASSLPHVCLLRLSLSLLCLCSMHAHTSLLSDYIMRPACKLFTNARPKMAAKDIDAIIACSDEIVMHAIKECSYQESVGMRVQSLDELRNVIMMTIHDRATLKHFLVSSNIFLDSPMDHSVTDDEIFKIFARCGGLHSLDAAKALEEAGERCADVHELIMKMMMVPKIGGAGIRTPVTTPPEYKRRLSEGFEEGQKLNRVMSKPIGQHEDVLNPRVPESLRPSPIAEEDEGEGKHDT
jgi:hypothetical protein